MSNPIDPKSGKPRRGRPPKHPFNQYTGARARRIEYVRNFLYRFLEEEHVSRDKVNTTRYRYKGTWVNQSLITNYWRHALLACRMLLACEGVFPQATDRIDAIRRNVKTRENLVALGSAIEAGDTVRMPGLLKELKLLVEESTPTDTPEPEEDDDHE